MRFRDCSAAHFCGRFKFGFHRRYCTQLSSLQSIRGSPRVELSFWQSMPISDRATVMSKVATSVLVIPAIYLAILTVGSMIFDYRRGGIQLFPRY